MNYTNLNEKLLLNLLEKIKLELGHKIVPFIYNKNNNWPLDTLSIRKTVNSYIQLYNYIVVRLCDFIKRFGFF